MLTLPSAKRKVALARRIVYLAEENVYRCPAGEKLTSQEHAQNLHRYRTNVCRNCSLKKPLHARTAAPDHALRFLISADFAATFENVLCASVR
jgi:hypothetical protein